MRFVSTWINESDHVGDTGPPFQCGDQVLP
jgi:hypothetical protein